MLFFLRSDTPLLLYLLLLVLYDNLGVVSTAISVSVFDVVYIICTSTLDMDFPNDL